MANRLAQETSPYLLQHAENPVDWYPWGEEALAEARTSGRPIFLSIGYAACHWCHVMERESFEDADTAAFMNENFVNIKVDREERPDLDSIYMRAVQALTGRGGWPMSVWLAPDGAPFFGGTYFPDEPRHGMSSFRKVLEALSSAWTNRPDEVAEAAKNLSEQLRQETALPVSQAGAGEGLVAAAPALDGNVGRRASLRLASGFDAENGGWGAAPKFPQAMALEFLLVRHVKYGDDHAQPMVERSLDRMAAGGIYDQLGGGFHRYSVDAVWLAPHFEKMLYDNSQMARVYTHGWQVLGHERYRRVAEETLDYVVREMTHPDGGFYSTQDADSEGVEGEFFVWTVEEVEAVLGPEDAALFMAAYDVTPAGNFEGRSILRVVRTVEELAVAEGNEPSEVEARLASARARLMAVREKRVRPARDEKILAAWNGLMIAAFAEAAAAFGRPDYRLVAERAAAVVLARHRGPDGRLLRSWRDGHAHLNGYLEDHAHLIEGLLALYQTDFSPVWFAAARELGDVILDAFAAPGGGFFDTRDDHEQLIVRPQDFQDNAVPSGNSMAVTALLKLAALTGDSRYRTAAEQALAGIEEFLGNHPLAFGQWLIAHDAAVGGGGKIAIVGSPDDPATRALVKVVRERFRPGWVVAAGPPVGPAAARPVVPLLEDRHLVDGRPAAYVCRESTCRAPITDPQELRVDLDGS